MGNNQKVKEKLMVNLRILVQVDKYMIWYLLRWIIHFEVNNTRNTFYCENQRVFYFFTLTQDLEKYKVFHVSVSSLIARRRRNSFYCPDKSHRKSHHAARRKYGVKAVTNSLHRYPALHVPLSIPIRSYPWE